MPGLAQRNEQYGNGSSQSYSLSSANGFWSKHRDDVSYSQLQKFWNELAPQARQELLKIDKQTLFEQARKNMYCSRCNGLLLEGFLQIVMYGKSLQQEPSSGALRNQGDDDGDSSIVNGRRDEAQDPSVHPWGGLTTSRDGSLTLMDCYLYSKSLKGLQNVFDTARARERERELLYPDACGGGGRGWISQGIVGYGRGHGTRETCALHTARLSCDTLVDFWSALGEETRQSLLRMKEEDFIERLMYRFDSKRFCRDCRRNVIREFKELKELKRMRRETRCTSWFCVADTAFQYEVSDDTIYADWHNTFADATGTYCHFEWAVGTSEGKADILEFENVGMNGSVSVDGLDLGGLSACFITLRAWKLDGRCTEISVKAHALKSGQCVHSRLVVGDGFVTITRGESIRRFFEHAEEAEEEEDDDSMDKDGNDIDGECSRPQKHAKSPELAREFLLDAATVIFKEQVEKAFREGTARQNAHSIFVCLALKLLEERVHVACKEIITLEKQVKLLEEEEKEKHEEEERKERRRVKEREKKLRRKERLKGKEKDKDKDLCEPNQLALPDVVDEESSLVVEEEEEKISISRCDLIEDVDDSVPLPHSPVSKDSSHDCSDGVSKDGNRYYTVQYSRRRSKGVPLEMFLKWSERRRNSVADENSSPQNRAEINCSDDNDATFKPVYSTNRQSRVNGTNANGRCGVKSGEKLHCTSNARAGERYDYSCSCNHTTEYRPKIEPNVSGNKSETSLDIPKQLYPGTRLNQADQTRDTFGRPKSKLTSGNPSARDLQHPKKVWEPMESKKKYPYSNSESDVTQSFPPKVDDGSEPNSSLIKPSDGLCSGKTSVSSCKTDDDDNDSKDSISSAIHPEGKNPFSSKEERKKDGISVPTASIISSSSDNCSSSCLSEEGDSNTASSNLGINDSSSTSDSEDSSLRSDGKNGVPGEEKTTSPIGGDPSAMAIKSPPQNFGVPAMNGFSAVPVGSQKQHQTILTPLHSQNLPPFPVFQAPYYHQSPVFPTNGLLPFSHPSPYLFGGPPLGSRFSMSYNPVQHLAHSPPPPLYTPGPLPFYQSISRPSREGTERRSEAPIGEDAGFSLFHFGGPVALSTGCQAPIPPKDEIVGDFAAADLDEDSCRKGVKNGVEEYNLFAASNGIRFSFF